MVIGVGQTVLRILGYLFLLILVAMAGAAGTAYWAKMEFEGSGPLAQETMFVVPKGASLTQIAEQLEKDGLISNAYVFRAGAYYLRKQGGLKAGEYTVPAGASMQDILVIFESGKAITYKLTVPEGLTTAMIIELVRKHEALSGDVTVLPTEGQLLPETYVFSRGMARNELLRRMALDHNRVLNELWEKRAPDLPIKTKYEAVILASIVEKETGVPRERPHVAGVFVNRLRKGMRLESDPTIIYGITQGYPLGRGIRQSELQAATPYNTYAIAGLPPTPIANPGRESLAAVLNPMATEDIFFVADGTGGHAFASTLEEHEKNVARWRQIEKQRAAGGG
ncbi:MAG TPA: endolytic transglycosylase MltG [Alphaproteobacteria bacterium]|nr:endolytic transglycosylase MltG [Alphaproteobacteria bacterium]HAJ48263.1 endolytic transglycosylase MltG [Alphaproteobacteria bacterium]